MITPAEPTVVYDHNGVRAHLSSGHGVQVGNSPYLTLRLDTGEDFLVPADLIYTDDDGQRRVRVDLTRLRKWYHDTVAKAEPHPTTASAILEAQSGQEESSKVGWEAAERASSATASEQESVEEEASDLTRVVIPVVEEQLRIGKRKRETGRVRIRKHTEERTELVEEPLLREDVELERVPVNRPVDEPPEMREEGDTLIIPVLREELVVSKRLVLVEELRITRQRTQHTERQEVDVRSEQVDIEHLAGDSDSQES